MLMPTILLIPLQELRKWANEEANILMDYLEEKGFQVGTFPKL